MIVYTWYDREDVLPYTRGSTVWDECVYMVYRWYDWEDVLPYTRGSTVRDECIAFL